jgi:homeobox protein cut-like
MATKLQTLALFWQNFGLADVQKRLDEVATDITTRQDETDHSRKCLIELLREFKKSNNDEIKQSVAPVVKSFQNEVDSLAKRSKAAEKAFFDIYKTMADMPDPLPILEQSVERNQQLASKIQDFEIETKQLRETMGDQAKEIMELKTKEKKMIELQVL